MEPANKEKQKEARGVDSVTDFVPETEADSSKAQELLGTIQQSVKFLGDTVVVIKEEDVKLLMDECEVSKEVAERMLKLNDGNIKQTLSNYLKGKC